MNGNGLGSGMYLILIPTLNAYHDSMISSLFTTQGSIKNHNYIRSKGEIASPAEFNQSEIYEAYPFRDGNSR